MPWNDNSNPGPWGSSGGSSGGGASGGGSKGDGDKGEKDKGERDRGEKDRGERDPDKGGRRPNPWGGGRGANDERPRIPRPDPTGRPRLKGPEFDDLMRQLGDRFRRYGPGGAQPSVFAAIIGAAFAAWALSGLYVVQPDQEAVVTRFGAYTRSDGPGLRYHLPTPIEAVEKVSVTSLNRLDVGGVPGADVPAESLMLTGDENIVDLNFTVQWRVSDAASYLFRVDDPDDAVKMTAESAMREVIGTSDLQGILTTGRGKVQQQAADLMQKILDSWGAGVTIVEVQIRSANPPQEVIAAFREVANAGQDAESSVNEANTYSNRVVNEAKGDAARITQAAQAYREQVVREAQGEADRFAAIDAEYKHAPAVTRQRLYTETMERVLHNANKVVVDTPKGGTAPIVLPPGLFTPRTPSVSVTAPPPPANQNQGQSQNQGQVASQDSTR